MSLTEALDLTTPTGRAMAGLLSVFAEFEHEILRETDSGPVWRKLGRTGNGSVGRRPLPNTPPRSGNYIAPASANPRSPDGLRSAEPRYAAS